LSKQTFAHNKKLGQHFLHQTAIIHNMMQAILPQKEDNFLEIGPGMGALTNPLLEKGCKLLLIEKDERLIPHWQSVKANHPEQLNLLFKDVLTVDFSQHLPANQSCRLIGNLPYNISTPILFHCLQHINCFKDLHLMLQKEVAERILAKHGNKTYGRLTVMIQAYFEVKKVLFVSKSAFKPPPKVDSMVISLKPIHDHQQGISHPDRMAELLRKAFSKRRKMLSAIFKDDPDFIKACEQHDISLRLRPEQIAVAQWISLAESSC
jgi:16S rRNA (adenine1518-N6/adenine1519-N6)-dimethyltransferase